MPWSDLLYSLKPEQLSDRLKSYWGAIGVVSALMCTISFSSLLQKPTPQYKSSLMDILVEVSGALMGLSSLCSGCTVLLATLFYSQMNQVPTPDLMAEFVRRYQKYFGLPTIFFQLAIILLLLGCFVWMLISYGVSAWLILLVEFLIAVLSFYLYHSMQKTTVGMQKQSVSQRDTNISLEKLENGSFILMLIPLRIVF